MHTIFIGPDVDLQRTITDLPSGILIMLSRGEWRLSAQLRITRKKIRIMGMGKGKSIISFNTPNAEIEISRDANLSFERLTVQQNQAMEDSQLIKLESSSCEFVDCLIHGFSPETCRDDSFRKDGINAGEGSSLKIRNCDISNFAGTAVVVADNSVGEIIGSTFTKNYLAMVFKDLASGSVIGNTFSENHSSAIHIRDKSAPLVVDNTIQAHGSSGICISSESCQVMKNVCSENSSGISISAGKNLVKENTCSKNRMHGISIFSRASGIISQNNCSNNGEDGICIDDDAYPNIIGNICNENKSAGIRFIDHTRGRVAGNQCDRNGIFGIYKSGRAHPDYGGNDCAENGKEDVCLASATWYDADAR